MKRRALVWFRQDLRLNDNEAISAALRMAEEIIPVYVFDDRTFKGTTRFGFPKTNKHRAQFIIESVEDLSSSIQKLGNVLQVKTGHAEDIIAEIAKAHKCSWVFCNRERTSEEVAIQDALEQKLWGIGIELIYTRGKMLFHTQDLPVPVQHTPDIFTQFRKETEGMTNVRIPLPYPTSIPAVHELATSDPIPALQDLGYEPYNVDQRSVLQFKGGETEGLKRLHYYLWEKDLIKTYKETRNGLIGGNYSSKFSPWLSQGCLSPKTIYHEIKRYELERGANESTYWMFFELLWRDFFRLMGKKYGDRIFKKGGIQNKPQKHLKDNQEMFELWANAKTGVPFIDANIRELNATGWMSNRGRQNTASFLVRDLKVNWQMGAEYFESMLLDYDPCSNWGNWNYVAGVGSDPREDRYFNILTQAKNYDPNGDFVKLWCPEFKCVPAEKVHRPDLICTAERQLFKMNGYPKSVVKIEKWIQ